MKFQCRKKGKIKWNCEKMFEFKLKKGPWNILGACVMINGEYMLDVHQYKMSLQATFSISNWNDMTQSQWT